MVPKSSVLGPSFLIYVITFPDESMPFQQQSDKWPMKPNPNKYKLLKMGKDHNSLEYEVALCQLMTGLLHEVDCEICNLYLGLYQNCLQVHGQNFQDITYV